MDRRQLLHSSLGAIGLTAVCCTTPEIPSRAVSASAASLTIDLAQVPELQKPGNAAKLVDMERNINLIVVHGRRNEYAALERSCTQGGAQVAYNRRNRTVQCSSWGHSEFSLDGAVLGGSAKKPLRAFAVRRTGNQLEIQLEARP